MNLEHSGIESLKEYLRLIVKKKLLFALTAVLIMTAAVIVSYTLPKKYEAKSTVFIERNVISNLVKGIAITPSMEDRLRVLSYSMKSRNLLSRVIKALDMRFQSEVEAEEKIEILQKQTSIQVRTEARGGMDLFIISYRDKDPKFARDYVNTLVNMYIEGSLSEKRDEAYGANTFLSEQIAFFKNKLDKIDADILNFRKEKGIFVSVDERAVVSEIKSTEEQLENIKTLKMELKAKIDSIAKQMKDGDAYVAVGQEKSAAINALQNRLNKLLLTYTEDYPDVLSVKAEIEALKRGIVNESLETDGSEDISGETLSYNPVYQELKTEHVRVESDLAALTAREKHLQQLIESKKEYLRNIPAEKKRLVDMERQRETDRQIYEELILRHGQSEVSKQMEVQDKGATFNIVDPAVLPTKPVSPNRVSIMLLGIIASFGGAFGLIFLLDSMDNSIRTLSSLKTLGLPVLAVIPAISNIEDMNRKRKDDILLYSSVGVYILFILILVVLEVFELTYVDKFVETIKMQLSLFVR